MKNKKISLLTFFISIAIIIYSQPQIIEEGNLKEDTASVNLLLEKCKSKLASAQDTALLLANKASELSDKLNYPKGKALALKYIGSVYYYQANYVEALNFLGQSLQKYKEIKDYSGVANLHSNIGVIYYDQGDDVLALENYIQSLKYAEQANDKYRSFIALNNIGGIYYLTPVTYDKALDYYSRAIKLCEELGKKEELGAISVNIGSIYLERNDDAKALSYFEKALNAYGDSEGSLNAYNGMGKLYKEKGKLDSALDYHNKALTIAQKFDSKLPIIQTLMGLGDVYVEKSDYRTALKNYTNAEKIALEIQANHELSDLYDRMSQTYAKNADYSKAFKYHTLYSNIKDTLYNVATNKKLGQIQFEFNLEKKQSEVNLLTKDNDLQAVKIKRQQLAKNAFMVGLFLAFIIALLIYRGYRNKVKTHKILDKQKNEIEGLLLNILPKEVAGELQRTGHATPKHYDSASVMFTDFKSFTVIADNMSPKDLVEELDACFIAFDGIIEKYKLEKIKTIGDSYMCAGGIPLPDATHVLKIVKAGLEIQHYVSEYNQRRQEKGLEPWNIRIGIHVGPIIAGVVGKKKYAYDIWGSTVNIASRMESNGEPGKVNISSATYDLIKDYYECTYRGKISAKNIGEIDMYFIEHEHRIPLNLTNTEQQVINQ
jgi:adenylate cyclase